MRAKSKWTTAVAAAACVGLLGACSPGGPGDGEMSPTPGPTTTAPSPTATATPSRTPSPDPTTMPTDAPDASLPAEEAAFVVYPAPGASVFDEPGGAVDGFATGYAGFEAPEISEFMQGDANSGEFEVTAVGGSIVTTVLVRRMSDDAWYVIGSATPNIQVAEPAAAAEVSSPLTVAGEALAFEGNVVVQVRDSAGEVLGQEPVTGSGGPDLGPLSGEIAYDGPAAGQGAAVFLTYSARDGSLEQVAAVPVVFG